MNTNKDLDRLEELLRKKPQVEKPSTKIPLKNPENYPQLHFDNQDDLDAFDSLMRKKVFFQNFVDGTKDFVSNGTKTTFGIFTKETRERKLETSNLVKKQNDYLQSLNKNPEFIKHTTQRYHTYSDWDHTREELVKVAKVGLLFLFLRELPLRHFHARAFVIGVTGYYLAYKHWGYFVDKASHYYLNDRDERFFENYPLIKELVTKRIENKSPSPVAAESDMWWKGHQPVFYHHHFKHWRYVMRNRREIQWDGTFNQPIFPFMQCNDRTAFVHNGVNENVVPGASGNW